MFYSSLFKRYASQPFAEVFAFFPYDFSKDTWQAPFKELAYMTKEGLGGWNYVDPLNQTGHRFPLLMNSLNYTFLCVQDQGLLEYSSDESLCCFNTGLFTPYMQEIYGVFRRNCSSQLGQTDWVLLKFTDSSDRCLKGFSNLPEKVNYVSDFRDLVFNFTYEVSLTNIRHIVEDNNDRLPTSLRGKDNYALAVMEVGKAILYTSRELACNYTLAVPFWYVEAKTIELLLPLKLSGSTKAELALVVIRDDVFGRYEAKTILELKRAYTDAKFLCSHLTSDWLVA